MSDLPHVYINSATQISCQTPLSEEWMTDPIVYRDEYVRSIDPDFKAFFPPLVARKMGRLLKRALITSLEAMKTADIAEPEAIITGTGLGCVENTEVFLTALTTQGEELLQPTHFMQSTHNTIGSLIAIHTHNHAYNATYSQKGLSFESALLDAFVQFQLGHINSALVGSHDEVTPAYFRLLKQIDYVGAIGQVPCSEASVSFLLSNEKNKALCELLGVEIKSNPSPKSLLAELHKEDVDVVMMGLNNNLNNDGFYSMPMSVLKDVNIPIAVYRPIFGECYSSSALGLYSLAHCIAAGFIPPHLMLSGCRLNGIDRALFINHSDGVNYSFIRLGRICG